MPGDRHSYWSSPLPWIGLAAGVGAAVLGFLLLGGGGREAAAATVSVNNAAGFQTTEKLLLTVGLSILYYAVPVIYFPEFVSQSNGLAELGPRWRDLIYGAYMLNPLSALISTFRKWMLVPTQTMNLKIRTEGMTELDYYFLAAAVISSISAVMAGLPAGL